MPHILISGTDINKNIKSIVIDMHVMFSPEYYKNDAKVNIKMQELEIRLQGIIQDYFDEYESDILSNHDYNTRAK